MNHSKTNTVSLFPAGISGVAYYVPPSVLTSIEIEEKIKLEARYAVNIPRGFIERISGIKKRYVVHAGMYNSTLAIEASRLLLTQCNKQPKDIDLLIFASTGQDLLEPATAHIIQEALGTSAAVMDVTNACNSFLNALEIATAFVQIGKYKSVLIATGEIVSKTAKYAVTDADDLRLSFPGYILGDAGTAVLVDTETRIAKVISSSFTSDSSNWDVATFAGGGSRAINDANANYFRGDGAKLVEPFVRLTPQLFQKFLNHNNITVGDISHYFIHQITRSYLNMMCQVLDIDADKVQMTIEDYGNVAAATLPLGMALRQSAHPPQKGDLGLLIGLAGGMSIGFVLVKY